MVIQKFSIEGAYDEAIEDAATRIYEASRPQTLNADNSCGSSLSDDVVEKNYTGYSPSPDNTDDNSEETTSGGGNSSDSTSTSDSYTDDDDIESNILYLEEKKQILKKAKIQGEKEEAYIALNAHAIANGREPSSRRKGSSTIWSEAKATIDEFKVVGGGGGSSSEEEQGNSSDLVVSDVETRESNPSHSTRDIRLSPSPPSPSPPENHVKNASLTRKRRKIDLSSVKCISSAEFAKHCAGNCFGAAETENDDDTATRSSIRRHYVSPTARWQQASEMQLSMASTNWISETVLKQILTLTAAAISQHRCSVIGAKNGE